MMADHADVTFDHGRIVRHWREVVSQKYSNLQGIHTLHDFLVLRNPGCNGIMKVRDLCYEGTLRESPMTLSRGNLPTRSALPRITDTYEARNVNSGVKYDHLKQMYCNFILSDQWARTFDH